MFDDDFIKEIYRAIAKDKELLRRTTEWNLLADRAAQKDLEGAGPLTRGDIDRIRLAGARAYATSEAEVADTELTEEQIEDRQRFYKQCALLLNLGKLSDRFETIIYDRQINSIRPDGPDEEKPFGGRFWRAKSRNAEGLLTNLVSSRDSSYMFEIPPHIMTQLTPKFKLFKVLNDKEGKLKQTEFIFPGFTDLNRQKNFKTQQKYDSRRQYS